MGARIAWFAALLLVVAACSDDGDVGGPTAPVEVDGVLDILDCRPAGQEVLGMLVDTHRCDVEGRTVLVHELETDEQREAGLAYLAQRFVGNRCPDGSYRTYVVVAGPEWAAVAPDRAIAEVIEARAGGEAVPVEDGSGVPISYLLPGDDC